MSDLKPLPELLADLRAAELDRLAHFQVRHPAVNELDIERPYQRAADPVACEADWKRVYHGFEAAVRAIVAYSLEMDVAP